MAKRDIRDDLTDLLCGFDGLVHLAALSNDPLGEIRKGLCEDINVRATIRLAESAKRSGVSRFVFASSCIMYGVRSGLADENVELRPQTVYARSKADAEESLCLMASEEFSPVRLRNGTLYGLSSSFRCDTVFNEFVVHALKGGEIRIRGGGSEIRPVVDVRDAAGAIVAVLEAPREVVHNEVFNVGAPHLNVSIGELAQCAQEIVPGARISVLGQAEDVRSYRADFRKWAAIFPKVGFRSVERGGAELRDGLLARHSAELDMAKCVRIEQLKSLMSLGELNEDLTWSDWRAE